MNIIELANAFPQGCEVADQDGYTGRVVGWTLSKLIDGDREVSYWEVVAIVQWDNAPVGVLDLRQPDSIQQTFQVTP